MNKIQEAKKQLQELVRDAYHRAVEAGALPAGAEGEIRVEIPKDAAHGDYATSFAMQAAKSLRMAPRAIGQVIAEYLRLEGSYFASAEMAGAGFLNFRLSDLWYRSVLEAVESMGDAYGSCDEGQGKRVIVEFVSANPTGPMTIGNARGGVLGDAIAAVLEKTGWNVHREFYINDAGHQIEVFGRSLDARCIQQVRGQDAIEFPEEGYHGEDIIVLAQRLIEKYGPELIDLPEQERRQKMVEFGLKENIARMHRDLERYRVRYDEWFPESYLHASGYVEETMQLLRDRGYLYEKDGAEWFRATDFGCEKDEVVRKSNGFYTYYAVDIAYHRNKFEKRKFDRAIDVFGADHHGHTRRFRAGVSACGGDPDKLDFVLMQLVHLIRDGEVVRMSKRTGKAITLSDLLDEIPVDAARFFFNSRQADTHLEFDMDLAVRQDSENPVYYVQYAHARILTLLENLRQDGYVPGAAAELSLELLQDPLERETLKMIAQYPEEVRLAAETLEPFRINRYLVDLAASFHKFYAGCRIKGAEPALLLARLKLAASVADVLRGGLNLLGVSAPKKM